MKTLILTIIFLAVLVAVPPAKADYLGSTPRSAGYAIEVITSSQVAITVLYVNNRGKITSVEPLLFVGNSSSGDRAISIPAGIVRILMQIDSVRGGSAGTVVKIAAGANRVEIPLDDTDPQASVTLDAN